MIKINIAYSFDENYAKHAYCSIYSLLANSSIKDDLHFYIVDDCLNPETVQKLRSLINDKGAAVTFIPLKTLIKDDSIGSKFSQNAYARLFLASYLNELDSIIYVDSDTIIEKSLHELMSFNMDGMLVAGVMDTVNRYYKFNIGLTDSDTYINDGGVIVLNLKLWRNLRIEDKCMAFIRQYEGNPPHNDQGTINYACRGKIKILPPEYNLMNPMFVFSSSQISKLFGLDSYYSDDAIRLAKQSPIVIHFTQEFFNRPWFHNCSHPLKDKYLNILNQTPWKTSGHLPIKQLSRNCRIQNFVFKYLPFWAYRLMIKAIELRHRLQER